MTANTGAITFSSTINSEASAARALSIVGIDGAVTVSGAIGTGTNGILGALDINTAEAAGNTGTISLAAIGTDSAAGAASITVGNSRTATLTLAGVEYFSTGAQTYESDDFNLTGADITIQTTNSNVTFQDGVAGQIVLSDTADLTIDTGSGAGNISITPTIAGTVAGGTTSEDITLDAGTGNIELLNTGAAVIATDIGDVTLTGGTISLYNDITTTATDSGGNAGNIDINGGVVLEGDVTFTTNNASIDFDTTIVSDTTPRALTIAQGSGTVGIGGNIGGTTNNDLGAIIIGATGNNGNITLSGDIGTDSVSYTHLTLPTIYSV